MAFCNFKKNVDKLTPKESRLFFLNPIFEVYDIFMHYTREKLDSFEMADRDRKEFNSAIEDLVPRVLNGEKVSLAEEEFACSIIRTLRKENSSEYAYNIKDIANCKNYRFRSTYLLYFNNVNGSKPATDIYGEIPFAQKTIDATYLHQEYLNWLKLLETKENEQDLIGNIARETKAQIKEIIKYANRRFLGSRYQEYLKKSIVLHSKFIYLTIKETFEEIGNEEFIIEIDGKNLQIDSYSFVHILFRHYSQIIKEHQQDKTYHFDENIDYKDIPNILKNIVECYKVTVPNSTFNGQKIYVLINNEIYAIWLRKITKHLKGNTQVEYFRVQTFYPVNDSKELSAISTFNVKKSQCGYDFLT